MFELDREVYCMKKVLSVSIKTIIFFVGWAICVSVIPIPDTASAVIWRFWAELIPLLSVIAITLIFWLADQKKIRLHLTGKPVYNIILGGVTGTIWLGASVGILSILGVVQIEGKNQIAMLWLWLLAAFLNTVMQEMLVWGDRIFEKCGIWRDEGGDGGKTLEIRGKRRLSARDGGANYQQS